MEGFFHQHRDLKEICDFTVDQTLKTLSAEEINGFVLQAFEERSIGAQATETEIEEMQFRAIQLSREFIQNKLRINLEKSFELFGPPNKSNRVIAVATNLSIDRGMNSSQVVVRGLILSCTKNLTKDLETEKAKNLKNKSDETKAMEQAFETATSQFKNLQNNFHSLNDSSITELMQDALDCVEIVTKLVLIPSEYLLRDFFECILGLDWITESIIQKFLQSDTTESWVMLYTLFRLLSQLSLISGYWSSNISTFFGEGFIDFLSKSKSPSLCEREVLREKLALFTKGRRSSCVTSKENEHQSVYEGVIKPVAIQFQ